MNPSETPNVASDLPRIVQLPIVHDQRGNLTVIEGGRDIPFEIRRVYYLYDVPGGSMRAGHGHYELEQVMIAMSGSFDVTVDSGRGYRNRFHLNRSYFGLYIPKRMWREVDNFSSGAVCMVLASTSYAEADYIRDFHVFCQEMQKPAD